MDYAEGVFKSDGSRVAYLLANATVKAGQTAARPPSPCAQKLLNAFDNGKIRVIPREDDQGNRLALRRDIGCTTRRRSFGGAIQFITLIDVNRNNCHKSLQGDL